MNALWTQRLENLKLIGAAAQPLVLIGALLTFVYTERQKSIDRINELSRPYYVKQLDLYLESARVTARLAAMKKDDPGYQETVNRFWELYWGELAFVESRPQDREKFADGKSVEELMVGICREYVSPDNPGKCTSTENSPQARAIALAHHESEEIRSRWSDGFRR
jgi:hypothetical protein